MKISSKQAITYINCADFIDNLYIFTPLECTTLTDTKVDNSFRFNLPYYALIRKGKK